MNRAVLLICALLAAPAWADLSATAASLSGAAAQSGALSNASQGNAQNITINGGNAAPYPTTTTIKTAPQVYAPPMGVTAPCRVAMSAGVSVIGVGVAAGGSVEDTNCNMRELSRLYHGIGAVDKAVLVADGVLRLMCQDEAAAKALGAACPPVAVQQPARRAEAEAPPIKVATACRTELRNGITTTSCPM